MPEIVWLNTIKQKEKRYLIDMKKKVILISVISVVIAFLATSCFDEKFTDNPSHVLSFSTDIVKFDTIFTDKGQRPGNGAEDHRARKHGLLEQILDV